MNTKDNQEAEREAFAELANPWAKPEVYNCALEAWLERARRATLTTPQVNEDVGSGEAVAEVVEERLADFMKPHATVKWHQTDFPIGTKFYTTPSPSNVLVEALQVIANGKLIAAGCRNVAKLALATYSSTDSVSISKGEYEAMKADAERLKQFEAWADEGLCPVLIYNDNGYWAVSFNGSGELDLNEPPVKPLAFTTWVEPTEWRETVSEAIDTARKSS